MKRKTQHTNILRSETAGWLPLTACAVMLAGCTAGDIWSDDDANTTPVMFTTGIQSLTLPAVPSAIPPTRTTIGAGGQTVWTQDDAVGVFMLAAGETMPAGILAGAGNMKYTVNSATGALVPAATPIYYPQEGTVDFIAYYPYAVKSEGNLTEDYEYNISVADQSNPAGIDVLRATAPGKDKSQTSVNLPFKHVLSKIILNITLGDGLSGLSADKITGVILTGMPASATLSLLEGSLTPGTEDDIDTRRESVPSDGANATFTTLVPPQQAGAYLDRRIIVTVDGVEYIANISDDDDFLLNTVYIYPVTVQKTGISVGKPAIADWTTNHNGEGTAT